MSGAAYGNHDESAPGSVGADRPGVDPGETKGGSAGQGAMGGSHATPASSGKAPGSGAKEAAGTTLTESADELKTPGAGAMPGGMQGGEVDPGAG